MSEIRKNHINFRHSPEFGRAVDAKKIDVLNMLVAIDTPDTPKRLGLTDLELQTITPSSERDALQQALDQLVYDGYVEKESFTPYDTGVFIGYELADAIPSSLPFAISAGETIKQQLEQLKNRMTTDGIASLAADEWALVPILRAAREQGMRGGDLQMDLVEIHRKLLDDLHDEGVEKWHSAFASTVRYAEVLFQQQDY